MKSIWRIPCAGVISLALFAGLLLASGDRTVAEEVSTATTATSAEATVDLAKVFAGQAPGSVAELKAMEAHVRKLAEKLVPCTVGVQVGQAQGSGVIISEDGYVLTAGHVVGKPNRKVQIILHDGRIVNGKTLGMNNGIDSGLIKITDKEKWPHAEMGDSEHLQNGQWLLATGHPGGYEPGREPVLRLGRVLASSDSVIITDCTLVGGDSGGPLFDMQGKVVGIHSRIGGPLTANMHVPVKTYSETWDRLVKGDAWGHLPGAGPYLGVQADPNAKNAKIGEVYPNTAAAKAGIKVGDVITKFDGHDVADFAALANLVRDKDPGNVVKVTVKRGSETLELEIELGQRGS